MHPSWIILNFLIIRKGKKRFTPTRPFEGGTGLCGAQTGLLPTKNLGGLESYGGDPYGLVRREDEFKGVVPQDSVFSITDTISGGAEKSELDNSTTPEPQKETFDRERRLIPYMTYYITQSLATSNIGTKQNNIFIPLTSPRENIFHLDTATKVPLNNLQNVNPQQIEILPKPVVRLPSPSLLTSAIQANRYDEAKEESEIFPQIYRLEPGLIRPQIQPQLQPQQIQSGSQSPQVIKLNPAPIEEKYNALQLIKIIPLMTKISLEDRVPKFFDSPQHHHAKAKAYALIPNLHLVTDRMYFKERLPLQSENSFQENKLYLGNASPGNVQFRLTRPNQRPDPNKYTIPKNAFKTITSLPYTDKKFDANDGRTSKTQSNSYQILIPHLSQLNPPPTEYGRESQLSTVSTFTDEKYVNIIPNQQKMYYDQKASDDQKEEKQNLVQSQGAEQLPRLRVPQEEKIRFLTSVTPVPVTNDLESSYWRMHNEGHNKKTYGSLPLHNVLPLIKETNNLPQILTPGNIDSGVKTLALILERLQKQKNHQYAQHTPATSSSTVEPSAINTKQNLQNPKKVLSFPEKSGTSTPGKPGIDYPIYSSIPQTNFDCSTQRYKGFFGDPDTNCQVWHYCDLNGGQASFLCPNGTIFSQVALTCDWWFNVKCASTSQLYVLNERLYKYILPFSPSFPEDYSGPVVDKYLAAKFKEMEAKSKVKVLKSLTNSTTTANPEITTESSSEPPTKSVEDFQIPRTEK